LLRHAYILGVVLILFVPNVLAFDLVADANKLQLAQEIGKTYIAPLGLKGKTGTQAIQTILSEGFRCDIEPVSVLGLDEPPLAECEKQSSGFGDICDRLLVSLRFDRQTPVPSPADFLKQLDTIKVHSALAFCPYKEEVPIEYLAKRQAAEAVLARQVDSFDLSGNAKSAYEKLLIDGFYCGFISDNAANDLTESPKLMCTKRPSGIKFCFESRLVMEVEWPKAKIPMTQLFGEMNSSQIKAIHSSCEIPAIKSNAPPI
jgi:hypothetical protein